MEIKGTYEGLSKIAKAFVVFIAIESCIIIALTIQRMTHPMTPFSETYSVLTLINSCLLTIFAIDGVFTENRFQIVGFVIVSISVMLIVTGQFVSYLMETGTNTNIERDVIWARFLSVCLFTPINVALSVVVYKDFGWYVYKKLGASPDMQEMYAKYQVFTAFLKLDLQFALNLVMIAGFFLYSDEMLAIDVIALVFTFLWALLGFGAVRQENKKATIVFLITSILLPAYVVYKFITYSKHPPEITAYKPMIYLVGAISIVVRTGVVIVAIICFRYFNRGLKDVFKTEKGKLSEASKLLVHE